MPHRWSGPARGHKHKNRNFAKELVDFIRRVHNPSNLGWKHKERRDVLPGPLPALHNHRVPCAPGAVSERLHGQLRRLFAGRSIDRTQRCRDRLAVLVAGVFQTVTDQVHDARLHGGARVSRANRFGQPLQPVNDRDQDVLATAGLEFVEHLEPELRALGLLDPQPEHVALAVRLDAQGQVHSLVAHHAITADLYAQCVEEDHRIHRLKRSVLPAQGLGHHLVGDRADEIGRNLGAVGLGQKRLDLAHAHATRVHRDDALVKAGETALVFGNQDRLEATVAVPRQFNPERAVIRDDGLAAGTVALVGLAFGFGLARRIAQMPVHLGAHRALDDGLVERQHQVLDLGGRHRPLDQFVKQTVRQGRQRPSGRCLRSYRAFLLHRHIHDFYLS